MEIMPAVVFKREAILRALISQPNRESNLDLKTKTNIARKDKYRGRKKYYPLITSRLRFSSVTEGTLHINLSVLE